MRSCSSVITVPYLLASSKEPSLPLKLHERSSNPYIWAKVCNPSNTHDPLTIRVPYQFEVINVFNVLKNCIRCTLIPLFVRGKHCEVRRSSNKIPRSAHGYVANQFHRPVLWKNCYASSWEWAQFDKAKSMILYLPPKYTDGFAKVSVSTPNLVPVPPASMSAIHSYDMLPGFTVIRYL